MSYPGYYTILQNGTTANIMIYGEIRSRSPDEEGIPAYALVQELDALGTDQIDVYISSMGGDPAEGLAIYNALKRSKAKVNTYADGFVCSAAVLPFMAGDERIMSSASLLMIHNTWANTSGNARELRGIAEGLDAITQSTINAYMDSLKISREELKSMMDAETWISPEDALKMGFATRIWNSVPENQVNQSVQKRLSNLVLEASKPLQEPLKLEVRLPESFRAEINELGEEIRRLEALLHKEQPAKESKAKEPENIPLKFLEALAGKDFTK